MVRSATAEILTKVNRRLGFDARAAAGSNTLVSHAEQADLPDELMKKAADDIRTHGGPGTRVDVDALIGESARRVRTLLGRVNQQSGSGAALVSEKEVKALLALDLDAGKRVARAYELITGKHITIPSPSEPAGPPLSAARIALIEAHARAVANSGDMMTGEIPPGNYRKLDVLRDDPPRGRTHTVYIPLEAGGDPNDVEVMWLLSVDAEGIHRIATFPVPVGVGLPGDPAAADVVASMQGAIDGLGQWHESGDNGVDTRVLHLAGVGSAQAALEDLLASVSSGQGGALLPAIGADAITAFRTRAMSDLEDWRRERFYEDGPVPASDDATAAMAAFDSTVASVFGSIAEVRTARGNDGENYLLGRARDGYVAVVIWPYRDG